MSADPLTVVWVATAARLGLTIRRSPDVFASTDGEGTLTLGAPESLDPDDHLAQLVLHECCHWIVAGADAVHHIDWGFPPMEGLHWHEYPTLRLQAWLADRHDLRALLAPTTLGRAYWDRLDDPLRPLDDSPEEARIIDLTRTVVARSRQRPWQPALDRALAATAAIITAARRVIPVSERGLLAGGSVRTPSSATPCPDRCGPPRRGRAPGS